MARLTDDSRLADHRIAEWLLRERKQREEQTSEQKTMQARQIWQRDAEAPPPVITIAHQVGTGGDAVARAVAEQLGGQWQVWDQEIIEAVAKDAQVQTKMVAALDEHVSSALEEFVRDVFGLYRMEPLGYQHHLARVLLSVGQQGQVIFVGRAANFLLPNALHVWVRAGTETRVRNLMQVQNLSRNEATRLIHHTDQERAAFIQNLAHHRIDEEGAYDLVVWTDRLGAQIAAAAIAGATRTMFGNRS